MESNGRIQSSAGKTVAWINYMTNTNRTFGNFAINDNEAFMVLNRNYELSPNEFHCAVEYEIWRRLGLEDFLAEALS